MVRSYSDIDCGPSDGDVYPGAVETCNDGIDNRAVPKLNPLIFKQKSLIIKIVNGLSYHSFLNGYTQYIVFSLS